MPAQQCADLYSFRVPIYIAERLEAGCISFQELVEESFRDIPHTRLKNRIDAVTTWKGLSRAALQRIADRHLEASCPGWLAKEAVQ